MLYYPKAIKPTTLLGKRSEGVFQFPFMLAEDKGRFIYVVDVLNSRLQKFNSKGVFFHNQHGHSPEEAGSCGSCHSVYEGSGEKLLLFSASPLSAHFLLHVVYLHGKKTAPVARWQHERSPFFSPVRLAVQILPVSQSL